MTVSQAPGGVSEMLTRHFQALKKKKSDNSMILVLWKL